MSVTVIIVNWNSGDLLKASLHHLFAQTVTPDHVIVVDNASEDDSLSDLDSFRNLQIIRMNKNLGFAAGNNVALNLSKTKYVALLNPDAFPAPEWLERLLAAAENKPKFSAFGSRQLCDDKPGVLDGIGDCYHLSGLVWRERYKLKQREEDLKEKEIFSPCAAAALYRLESIMEAGGFDEDYFCYVEDMDLGFRLRLLGHKALYVPDAVVRHIGSATTGGQKSRFSIYHGHRNLVWTFVKNMPSCLFWGLLPMHLLMNLITMAIFASQGMGGTIWDSKRDAILGLRHVWKKRQVVQSRRKVSTYEVWSVLNKSMLRS